jgi:hypothetical protein
MIYRSFVTIQTNNPLCSSPFCPSTVIDPLLIVRPLINTSYSPLLSVGFDKERKENHGVCIASPLGLNLRVENRSTKRKGVSFGF